MIYIPYLKKPNNLKLKIKFNKKFSYRMISSKIEYLYNDIELVTRFDLFSLKRSYRAIV